MKRDISPSTSSVSSSSCTSYGFRSLMGGRVCRLAAVTAALLTAILPFVYSQQTPGNSAPVVKPPGETKAAETAVDLQPKFLSLETRGTVGQSQVIAFAVSAAAPQKKVFDFSVQPAEAVEVLMAPTVLNGEKTGFVRIVPRRPGKCILSVGKANIALEVSPAADIERGTTPLLQLVAPLSGAQIWGQVTVGVEFFDESASKDVSGTVDLVLPGGKRYRPEVSLGTEWGPHRRFTFTIDADKLPAGPLVLAAEAILSDGRRLQSPPIPVRVIRPSTAAILKGECEDLLEGPKPKRLGENAVTPASRDRTASGGAAVINPNNNKGTWVLPVNASRAGTYQLAMRVRGDFACGTFPTLAVALDENQQPITAARLTDSEWRRVIVGRPIYLTAGEHFICVSLANSMTVFNETRNLSLDTYELVRLDDSAVRAGSGKVASEGGSPMMGGEMMSGGAMMAGDSMMSPASPKPADAMMAAQPMMAGGDAMMSKMAAEEAPPGNVGLEPPRVAFQHVFDMQPVTGPVSLRAACWWPRPEVNRAPKVTLFLNGKAVGYQYGSRPEFRLEPRDLQQGVNTVHLTAVDSQGYLISSPEQRILFAPPGPAKMTAKPVAATAVAKPVVSRLQVFTAQDDRWDEAMLSRCTTKPTGLFMDEAAFYSNGEVRLNLPEELEGEYVVTVNTRGTPCDGPPELRFRVADNAKVVPAEGSAPATAETADVLATVAVEDAKYHQKDVGKIRLSPGKKALSMAFLNDRAEKKDGKLVQDRNVWVKNVTLRSTGGVPDTAPIITVAYPDTRREVQVADADAVVAEIFAPRGIKWADLIIDGVPQELKVVRGNGFGQFYFPFSLEGLSAGRHKVRVVAEAWGGKKTESQEFTIVVSAQPLTQRTPYQRALHLASRFGYGPEPEQMAEILTRGEVSWLRTRLGEDSRSAALRAQAARVMVEYAEDRGEGQVINPVMARLLTSPNPVRTRFVLWAQNHFSVWIGRVQPPMKVDEDAAFDRLGVASFPQLLWTSATSPAMLVYLDQARSFAKKINENYAREIMELHTLGVHGGYTQADVTELANLLNGWTVADEAGTTASQAGPITRTFRFDPWLSNPLSRRVFGMEFGTVPATARYDRVRQALEMLAAHPATARYVCGKLAGHYVGLPAPAALVDELTATYMRTGGDMQEVLVTLSRHPDFWASVDRPRLATPLDFALRAARSSRYDSPGKVLGFLRTSGTGLFDRATPDGYPETDDSYASSNALLQRWRFAGDMQGPLFDTLPRELREMTTFADPAAEEAWLARVLRIQAMRLCGRPLSPASKDATLKVANAVPAGDPQARARAIGSFLLQTPEASLR